MPKIFRFLYLTFASFDRIFGRKKRLCFFLESEQKPKPYLSSKRLFIIANHPVLCSRIRLPFLVHFEFRWSFHLLKISRECHHKKPIWWFSFAEIPNSYLLPMQIALESDEDVSYKENSAQSARGKNRKTTNRNLHKIRIQKWRQMQCVVNENMLVISVCSVRCSGELNLL